MESGTGITPVMNLGNGCNGADCFGGGAFVWIFGLLILMGMLNGGGGMWGNNGNGNANAIQSDINRGFDNQNVQAQTRDILTAVNDAGARGVAATNQVYHDVVGYVGDKYQELDRDVWATNNAVERAIANQNECCCSTKMMLADTGASLSAQISQNKYENAMALAAMEQRLTAKMDANEITRLRDKVQRLELGQATAGVLRFPNSWSYGAGPFPPIFAPGQCGGNGYNNM